MNDGFDIPIGGDLGPLQEAFDRIIQSIEQLGNRITAAFAQSNAAVAASVSRLSEYHAQAAAAATAQQQMAGRASGTAAKVGQVAKVAGEVGNALTGAASAANLFSRASRLMAGASLANSIAGLVARAGSLRGAIAAIPGALNALASNPTFRKIVIGAAAAAAAVITIRTAWRTAAAGARLLQTTASAVFHGVIAAARSAGNAVRSVFSSISSLPGKMLSMPGMPMGAMIGGIGGLAGGITLALKSIDKAATMENLETAFAPLIGGAEKAKVRIADLAHFAAVTPFELPEVAQASRVLEVLTKGALSTGEGLRMVGDVAAATQQPFQEIAMWVGRLYDGLQSGRPVGEAMMRLQELGVVSGDVRGRIEALQKSGAAGPAVWNEAAAALNRFGGSMERQSVTWNGKLSTLRDSISMVMAEFGKPIIDGLKPFLDMAIAKIDTMKSAAAAFGNAFKNALNAGLAAFQTGTLGDLLFASVELAMINGVNKFAAGITGTVNFLAGAMENILSAVTKGLKSSGITDTLMSLFMGIGDMLSSMLRSAAADFADMIGRSTMAKQLRGLSAADATRSENRFATAKFGLGSIDLAGGFSAMASDLQKAQEIAKQAFEEANANPWIDPTRARQKLDDALAAVKEQMLKNQKAIDDAAAERDSRLQNAAPSGPSSPLADQVSKAAAPAVMSLTRIGGGGFSSTVMSSLVVESRRQTGLLKAIAKNTSIQPVNNFGYA